MDCTQRDEIACYQVKERVEMKENNNWATAILIIIAKNSCIIIIIIKIAILIIIIIIIAILFYSVKIVSSFSKYCNLFLKLQ